MPFLSIIVPVYNVENYLEECLDSILAQTFTDYELILVDDGSIDKSRSICEQYKEKYNVVKVIHKENGGQTSARKAGVKVAQGKYIGFVDADDRIKPTMYQKLCVEAIKNDSDIVICDVLHWDGDKVYPIKQGLNGGVFSQKTLEEEIYPHMLYTGRYYEFGFLPAMWNKIYKSNILKKNQMLVDERIRIGEDAACSYLCILDAKKICYLKNEYEYYYRLNSNSVCQNWTNLNISSAAILLDYLYDRFMEKKNVNIMEQYWYYYSYMLTNLLYDYGEAVRKKYIECSVEKDFNELLNCKSFQIFRIHFKTIRIPFYRMMVAYSVIYGRTIDMMIWSFFVFIRFIIVKIKMRERKN